MFGPPENEIIVNKETSDDRLRQNQSSSNESHHQAKVWRHDCICDQISEMGPFHKIILIKHLLLNLVIPKCFSWILNFIDLYRIAFDQNYLGKRYIFVNSVMSAWLLEQYANYNL